MINDHRQWLYKNGAGKIFEVGDEIPEGYTDLKDSDEWDNLPISKASGTQIVKMTKAELIGYLEGWGYKVDHDLKITALRTIAREM